MTELKELMPAPDFKALNQDAKEVSLKDFRGKKLILYFYPKDNTPGCTAEACNLNDNFSFLISKGFTILGVSPDSADSHRKFITKYNLSFNLLTDTSKDILKLYGAWGEKNMYGKKVMGVIRKTFVIDENGIIIKIINKVNTSDHSNQICKELGII